MSGPTPPILPPNGGEGNPQDCSEDLTGEKPNSSSFSFGVHEQSEGKERSSLG